MKTNDLIERIEGNGWVFERHGKGSHRIFKHPNYDYHISIPDHGSKDLGKGLINQILKQAGIK